MARPRNLTPKLCARKDGRAFTKVNGKYYALGTAGTKDCERRYAELILANANGTLEVINETAATVQKTGENKLLLAELFALYLDREISRFSRAEQFCVKGAIKVARECFGATLAADFGPLNLRTVVGAMVDRGWCRDYINKQTDRLRKILKWASGWEMIPGDVVTQLEDVPALRYGETTAPESKPRHSLPEADIQAVRAVLPQMQKDIFDLLRLTGSRPGEIINLTTGAIDRSDEIWKAALKSHKTLHQGKSRTIYFNHAAQLILLRYFHADPKARLFQIRRDSFGTAVKRACEVAFGMPEEIRGPGRNLTAEQRKAAIVWRREHCWSPHWLRHCTATFIADELGIEAAQRLLGHSRAGMSEHYARNSEKLAIEAAKHLG